MTETRIRLITRGDDCGSSHTANQAILEAVDRGILKNVSIMACCEAIEEAAALFAGKKEVCFGLHATMNAEWDNVRWGPVLPISQVPSLVDESGHFFQTVKAFSANSPNVDEIMAELQAQLNRLRELGFHVTYADQHMGFGSVIKDFDILFDNWCKREGLINALHFKAQRLTGIYKFLKPGVGEVIGDPIDNIILELDRTEPGQYLIVGHPAYDNEEMRVLGHEGYTSEQVAVGRHWERLLFSDPRIVGYVKNNGVTPIRFDEAL
jgi:hypothetical protein